MAVAHHGVNRSGAKAGDKAVVFGAGPIGLGAVISLKDRGVEHVVVTDIQPTRLETALKVGADAVINAAEEDVFARLIELHGEGFTALGRGGRAGTDVYIDAAGAPQVVDTVFQALSVIRDRGVTILLVEQRAQRTVAFADRTYVLANGELVTTLAPKDADDTERLVAAYLGR